MEHTRHRHQFRNQFHSLRKLTPQQHRCGFSSEICGNARGHRGRHREASEPIENDWEKSGANRTPSACEITGNKRRKKPRKTLLCDVTVLLCYSVWRTGSRVVGWTTSPEKQDNKKKLWNHAKDSVLVLGISRLIRMCKASFIQIPRMLPNTIWAEKLEIRKSKEIRERLGALELLPKLSARFRDRIVKEKQ